MCCISEDVNVNYDLESVSNDDRGSLSIISNTSLLPSTYRADTQG